MYRTPKTFNEIKERLQAEINRLSILNNQLQEEAESTKKTAKNLINIEKARRKDFEESNNSLQEKLDGIDRERRLEKDRWKIRENCFQTQINEKDKELETRKSVIRNLKNQKSELDTNYKELQNELTQKDKKIGELTSEISDLNFMLESGFDFFKKAVYNGRQQEIEEWKNYCELTSDLLNKKNCKIITLKIKLSKVSNDFRKFRKKNWKEIEETKHQLQQHYENRLTQTKEEIIRLGGETNSLNQELAEEEVLVDLKDCRIDKLTETIQQQASKIDRLTKSGQQKQKTIDQLTIQLGEDQTKNKQLVADNKSLSELLTQREKENERLTNRLNNAQQKAKRTKTYQQNRTTNLAKKNNTLTGKLTYYSDQDKRLRGTIQNLQNHACIPCPLIHLPEPHICPIVNQTNCSHSDYQQIKDQKEIVINNKTQVANQEKEQAQTERDQAQKEKDSYQNQLTQQENKVSERTQQKIVQQLNTTFKLGLNQNERSLNQAISKLQELIDKPPLTVEDETIKQELVKAQTTITKLEKELTEKTPWGESIQRIIQIDEQLLNQNQASLIELNKQVQDYQQLASERNKLVLQQIKQINVQKLCQLIPQVKKAVIQQTLAKTNNYAELAQARNELIIKYLNSNQTLVQSSPAVQLPKQERVIWISLLVVSLVSIGGLLVKLRKNNEKEVNLKQ